MSNYERCPATSSSLSASGAMSMRGLGYAMVHSDADGVCDTAAAAAALEY